MTFRFLAGDWKRHPYKQILAMSSAVTQIQGSWWPCGGEGHLCLGGSHGIRENLMRQSCLNWVLKTELEFSGYRERHLRQREHASTDLERVDFSLSPLVKTSPPNAEDAGSVPSWGAKIPHASWPESQTQNRSSIVKKFNKDFKKM